MGFPNALKLKSMKRERGKFFRGRVIHHLLRLIDASGCTGMTAKVARPLFTLWQDREYGRRSVRVTASGMDDSEKGNPQVRSARGHPLLWKSLYEGLLQLEQDQGEG